jgi:hypothetical protein
VVVGVAPATPDDGGRGVVGDSEIDGVDGNEA